MPNTLAKNLHFCFSIIKQRPQPHQITHPHHHPSQPPAATTSAITAFFKNYNSLFEDGDHCMVTAPASPSSANDTDMADHEEAVTATPDLTAIYASRRFFISSPGTSNSIVDSPSSSSSSSSSSSEDDQPPVAVVMAAGGVAVNTYSPDPYVDFRKSMQEMVESRDLAGSLKLAGQGNSSSTSHHHKEEAWDYLQELLLSYLSLNPKSTHKYIVGAFADLVVTLMSPPLHHNNKSKTTTTTTTNTTTNFATTTTPFAAVAAAASSSSSSSLSCSSLSSSSPPRSHGGGDNITNHPSLGMLLYHQG